MQTGTGISASSTWLRDYLYIPLGGNLPESYAPRSILTMLLGGLWRRQLADGHSGVRCMAARWWCTKPFGSRATGFWHPSSSFGSSELLSDSLPVINTYLFTCLCWVFFRAQSFPDAITILSRMPSPAQVDPVLFCLILDSLQKQLMNNWINYEFSEMDHHELVYKWLRDG